MVGQLAMGEASRAEKVVATRQSPRVANLPSSCAADSHKAPAKKKQAVATDLAPKPNPSTEKSATTGDRESSTAEPEPEPLQEEAPLVKEVVTTVHRSARVADEPSPPSSPASTPAATPPATDIGEPAVDPVPAQEDKREPVNFPNTHGIQFHSWAQANSYERLTGRKIVPTIYVDEFLLKTLGLHDDVMQMRDVMGWRKVMTGN
ncbi:transducin family protein / WD-40 repeat family protein [Striga asiatica]|uniref:Transducin family protein / WD-40 repeat family protein n=1 Tax=Striga asiatica TaxID=4170 RepID=A0A5A7PKT1_STRAF|nr:transducin family protein / WD-40 repeat family protein [Striga asiatica]